MLIQVLFIISNSIEQAIFIRHQIIVVFGVQSTARAGSAAVSVGAATCIRIRTPTRWWGACIIVGGICGKLLLGIIVVTIGVTSFN